MSINIEYIEDSIDYIQRTSYLSKKLRTDCGPYVEQRQSLRSYRIANMLVKNGYSWSVACKLQELIKQFVQGAYERGIFVIASSVLKLKNTSIEQPEELIKNLRAKSPEYYDAIQWYPNDTFTSALKRERFSDDIAMELGPFVLRHVRAAFTAAIKAAAKKVIH